MHDDNKRHSIGSSDRWYRQDRCARCAEADGGGNPYPNRVENIRDAFRLERSGDVAASSVRRRRGICDVCADLAVPESSTHIEEFAELAYREGVRRMVLLSGRGEPAAQKAEQVLADSGLEWAVVRASWFAQNFSEGTYSIRFGKATWHFRSVRWGGSRSSTSTISPTWRWPH